MKVTYESTLLDILTIIIQASRHVHTIIGSLTTSLALLTLFLDIGWFIKFTLDLKRHNLTPISMNKSTKGRRIHIQRTKRLKQLSMIREQFWILSDA